MTERKLDISLLKKIISVIDLTSLNDSDDDKTIIQLCQLATTPLGPVAAVCIYPRFVPLAVKQLQDTPIPVATVSNFPNGDQPLEQVLTEIKASLNNGAAEIDVVMPYHAYLRGDREGVRHFLAACKSTCDQKILKVILETGALDQPEIIANATHDAITAGADFIKTSTGKHPIGATLAAAEIILKTILASEYEVGLKVSGGIRTIAQACSYIELSENILGEEWLAAGNFRIGASHLLHEVTHNLTNNN